LHHTIERTFKKYNKFKRLNMKKILNFGMLVISVPKPIFSKMLNYFFSKMYKMEVEKLGWEAGWVSC
jgi:hypothetical protein